MRQSSDGVCQSARQAAAELTVGTYWYRSIVPRLRQFGKKGSPYSITERMVPELIPVLGSQPAGDVSHKPDGRLPLLFARPAVTPATLKGLLPILLLGEQRHNGCEHCYPTAS